MSYNPYGSYVPQIPIQTPLIQPQERHVDRVHGEAGVDQYQMAPNSDVILLDETAPMIWLVKTDAAGYKTKHPYDITPHEKKEEPSNDNLVEMINALDKRMCAIEEALK